MDVTTYQEPVGESMYVLNMSASMFLHGLCHSDIIM